MNERAMRNLADLLPRLNYDIAVLTGDYRGKTYGPFEATLDGLKQVHACLTGPVYGVLGNHDTILMVPGLEAMGIRMLLNECEPLIRGNQRIHLAGIDDAHYYRVDNIEKAASDIPDGEFSILLSHTPEIYRQAAHNGIAAVWCGLNTKQVRLTEIGGVDLNYLRGLKTCDWRNRPLHRTQREPAVGTGSNYIDC